MIPKNKNPLLESPPLVHPFLRYINREYYCDVEEEITQWQQTLDENKEQRHKDFRDAYQATLCKCGRDKIKCKVKEVKCD